MLKLWLQMASFAERNHILKPLFSLQMAEGIQHSHCIASVWPEFSTSSTLRWPAGRFKRTMYSSRWDDLELQIVDPRHLPTHWNWVRFCDDMPEIFLSTYEPYIRLPRRWC